MNINELENLTVAEQVDARGEHGPGLLAARRAMVSVPAGGVLKVIASSEETREDIPLWCRKAGHRYLGAVDGCGYWKIFVERAN